MATTKPKHYFVNNTDFQIVASVVESKKGHTRFETGEDAETHASKMRKAALSNYLKNVPSEPLTLENAKNVIDKRDLLAFQGVKDLAQTSEDTVFYKVGDIGAPSVKNLIHSLGVNTSKAYFGGVIGENAKSLNMDNLFLADLGSHNRFVTHRIESEMDENGFYMDIDRYRTSMSCVYYVGDEKIPVNVTLYVEDMEAWDVARLLPERMMTEILMSETMSTMLTDKNLQ